MHDGVQGPKLEVATSALGVGDFVEIDDPEFSHVVQDRVGVGGAVVDVEGYVSDAFTLFTGVEELGDFEDVGIAGIQQDSTGDVEFLFTDPQGFSGVLQDDPEEQHETTEKFPETGADFTLGLTDEIAVSISPYLGSHVADEVSHGFELNSLGGGECVVGVDSSADMISLVIQESHCGRS